MKNTFIRTMLVLSILLINAAPLANAQTGEFSDLSTDHESYDTIMNLVAAGIIDGYEDGTVKPDQNITRAELMKIIVLGKGVTRDTLVYNRCFEDVWILEWYVGYVCYGEAQEWVFGYPDGTFRPGNNINNVEILSMIFNSYGLVDPDSYDGEWYLGYVDFAVQNGIIDEFPSNPGEIVTRAQAFEILKKTLAYIDGEYEPQASTIKNLTFTHPKTYTIDDSVDFEGEMTVYVNNDDDGIGFITEDGFNLLISEFGIDFSWEELFEGYKGKAASISIKEGQIEKITEFHEYVDGDDGMFIFKANPKSGTGESFFVVAHYTNQTTRAEILEMFKTIRIK